MDKATWERLGGNQGILGACNCLEMIFEIPKILSKGDFKSTVVEGALIDSWYVNIRGLIEYFCLRRVQTNSMDYSVKDFSWEFQKETTADWENIWTLASKWVGHISRDRGLYEWVETDDRYSDHVFMKSMSQEMHTIASNFCAYLGQIQSPSFEVLKITLKKFEI